MHPILVNLANLSSWNLASSLRTSSFRELAQILSCGESAGMEASRASIKLVVPVIPQQSTVFLSLALYTLSRSSATPRHSVRPQGSLYNCHPSPRIHQAWIAAGGGGNAAEHYNRYFRSKGLSLSLSQ